MAKQASKLIDPIEEALLAVEEAMSADILKADKEASSNEKVVSLAEDPAVKSASVDFELDLASYEDELKDAAKADLNEDVLLSDTHESEKTVKSDETEKSGGGLFQKLRFGKKRSDIKTEATKAQAVNSNTAKDVKSEQKSNKDAKPDVVKAVNNAEQPKSQKPADVKIDDAKLNEEEKRIDEQVAAILGGADALRAAGSNDEVKKDADQKATQSISSLSKKDQVAANVEKSVSNMNAEEQDETKVESSDASSVSEEVTALKNASTAKSEGATIPAAPVQVRKPQEQAPKPEKAALNSQMRPANDDEYVGISHAVRSNQSKPSNSLYWASALFSAVWLGLGGFASYQIFGDRLLDPAQWGAIVLTPNMLFLLAGTLIPIMLIWAFAVMVHRSQEMRYAVNVMTKAAQHLLEPEATSSGAVMNVGQAVRREIGAIQETVDQALSRASELESVMHNEVSLLERSYSENEMKMRGLIEQISNEREAVVSQSERVQAVISGTHSNLREDLDHTTQMIAKSIDEASNVLRTTVHASQQEITSSYSNVAEMFDDTFKEKTDHLIERFNEKGEGLVEKITVSGINAQTAFALQANELTDRMTMLTQEIEGGLTSSLSSIDETLSLRGNSLVESLESRSEKLETLLMNSQDDVNKVMDEQLTAFGLTISGKVDQVVDKIETRSKILAENVDKVDAVLETRVKHVNDTLIERAREVAGVFANSQKSLHENIDENIKLAASTLETGRNQISEEFNENIAGISIAVAAEAERANELSSQSVKQMGQQIQGLLENAESAIAIRTEHVSSKLEKSTRDLNSMLAERTKELNKVLKEETIPVLEGLESKGQSIASSLTDASQKIGHELDEALERASANTDGFVAKISESSQGVATELNDIAFNITDRGSEVASQVQQVSSQLVNDFTEATSKATTQMSNVSDATTEQLNATVQTFSNHVAEGSSLLSDKLESATDNAVNRLDSVSQNASARLSRVTETSSEKILSATESASEKLTSVSENASDTLSRVTEASSEKILSATESASEKLTSVSENAASRVVAVTEETNDKLVGTVEAFANHVAEGSQLLSSKLETATENASTKLSNVTEETNAKLVGTVEAFADRVSEGSQLLTSHVERVANTATENFANSSQHLTQQLSQLNSEAGRSTEEVATRIAKTTEYLAQRLSETSQGATEQLMEASKQSADRLEHVANETLKNNEFLATRVAESVENAVSHLSQEKHDFVEAISSQANSAAASIGNTKQMLRDEMGVVFEQINQSNDALHGLISGAGSKIGQIQAVLDEKTLGLQNAAHQVQATLGQATEQIDSNFDAVKATSGSIANDMANIGGRFEQHSVQLEQVASLLERTQSNLASNISGQHEMLEQLTGGMVLKSQEMENLMRSFTQMINDAMQKAEQGTKSLSVDLSQEFMKTASQATEQFARATEDMRANARAVQVDLEKTRSELKRGLNDLPDETKESTTALRRAVTDQIKALKELSSFVASSGKSVDVSQGFALASGVTAAQQAAPKAAASVAQVAPTAPVAPRPAASAAPVAAPKGGDQESSSWVGDLLRRASHDDEDGSTVPMPNNRAPEQLIDSLNANSVDIVKALDAKTSVELWKRYVGGEQDVFTRALSGVDVARTKSLIQSRFNSDGEFKTALERYVADFETLVSSQSDSTVKERYKFSDHGRVYKVLLEAIGKPTQV